jgi:TPR repeat protein
MTWRPFEQRGAQRVRRSLPLLPVLLGLAASVLSWQIGNAGSARRPMPPPASQAASSTPNARLPTVTIEAAQALERRVDRFVAAEVFQAPGESIMRWNQPVCPFVAGLPRMFDDYIQTRIADIARAANAPVAGKRCKTDLYVIASDDPESFLKKLWAKAPGMYGTRSEHGGVQSFLHSRDPVRVLFNSKLHCRVNSMDGGKSSDMMAFFLGGGGAQVDTTSPYFCGGGGSRLSYAAVNSIQSALIVVDLKRMQAVTTRELADYVAMIGLADIRPEADAGDVPTILRLFQHPKRPPRGLSAWDRSLLYSIYNTSQSSVLQMPDMETTVVARIEHQGDPGQASFPSSRSPPPLWTNEVIPQRDTNVVSWYRAAAEHGDADAQYALGTMYDEGQGVPRNYATAAKWYRRAAEQGDADAQSSLGLAYLNGHGTRRDDAKAFQWMGKAAEQGSAAAQYDLGLMYARGQSVPQNYATAAEWYSRAAEQGDARAQSALGLAYANGWGVARSYAKAALWFRRAAEQGYADAQFDLGVLYANGGGVPRDDVEAYKWWLLARADAGSSDDSYSLSLGKLQRSASQLTSDQTARARREASAWLAARRSGDAAAPCVQRSANGRR